MALKKAGLTKNEIHAIAYTRGPGLLGSLLVGVSFAKGLGYALQIPLMEVNHLEAHVLAHFIRSDREAPYEPSFPFLCLIVSGGHTLIVKVNNYDNMEVLGETTDDAAGEAFDKAAKILGLPYPGGPLIDKYAQKGNPHKFAFTIPKVPGFDFSFSGLKTAFLYLIKNGGRANSDFIQANLNDLCSSFQATVVYFLLQKLILASESTQIKEIAIAGGVSANSGLRKALNEISSKRNWNIYLPKMEYCTDNAAMIAITGYFKYLKKEFAAPDAVPVASYPISSPVDY